jgi:hypothetical protein
MVNNNDKTVIKNSLTKHICYEKENTGEDKDNPTNHTNAMEWRNTPKSTLHGIKATMQTDSGANCIVTNNIKLLQNIKFLKTTIPAIKGCRKTDPEAIICTKQLELLTYNLKMESY